MAKLYDLSWKAFDSEHVCYVIQPITGGAFKVGNAKCLSKRLVGIQGGNPDLLIVRALFSGGAETERDMHARLHDYRMVGEWFSEEGVPLLCSIIRADARLLWGTPWTEQVYEEPGPTTAEVRAKIRAVLMQPSTLSALSEVLANPKHASYKQAMEIVRKYGASNLWPR